MKMTGKRIISFALVLALCLIMLPSAMMQAIAATQTVFHQKDSPWGDYPYKYNDKAETDPATIGSSGCALLALVNAVHYLTGNFIDPIILAEFAISNGYRVSGSGTLQGFFAGYSKVNGAQYGYSFDGKYTGTANDERLIEHLKNGGVAIGNVPGHYIALVGYDSSANTFHIYDSAPSTKRQTKTNDGDVWLSQSTLTKGDMKISWYCLLSSTSDYASYLGKCTAYPTHITIKTTKSTYVKSLPCSEKTDANSENIEVASAGSQYEAIGLYRNTAGNLWYKVKAKNGSVGYMYAGDTTFVSEDIRDIVQSGITVPANHTQGNSYKLTGTVSSTYSKITKVSVYIYDAKGNKVTGAEAAVTGNKYSFSGSAIDNKTKFGSLFAGTHTYKVVAFFEYCYADDATTMTTWSVPLSLYEKTFNVVGSSASCSHSYSSKVTTAATCTTAGVKTYTCSKCSDSYTESIAATGHSWNSATCTAAKTCSTCGATSGTALGHSYNSGVVTTPATCIATGVKTYTCNTCAAKKTESIAATGHSWNNATCTAAKTCSTCGATSGSALGHSYNSGVITTAATCTTAGVKTYTCSKCSDSYTESIAATGHSWNSATCTTAKTCTTCGTTSGSALGHSYKTETTPPTCTEQGYTTHTCTACGDSYKDSATNALCHNYSDGICTHCGAEDPHYVTDTNAPQIIVQGTNARRGETVTAAIALKNNPGITSMKLKVTYDPMLTLTGITYNTDVGGQFQMPQTMASPVTLNWVSGTEDAEGDWTYATLTFVITDDAIGGTNAAITVTYDPDDVYDTTETNVAFSIQNGFIAIADYMPGDITNDGKINNKDVTRLLQYLSDWDVEVDEAALDVTGDGKINNKDVTRLLQYLSDWDVEIH